MTRLKQGFLTALVLLSLASQASAAGPTKITIAYASIGPSMSAVWMAKEIGAFKKYGLEPDLIYIASGPVAVQSLIGGDIDAAVAASNSAVGAIVQGASLVAVGSTINHPSHSLWVQPEIRRIEDLRGKTLGVTRFGAVTHNLTVLLLRKHGLESDVKIRQLGGVPEMGAAFQQRAIAGAVASNLRVDANTPVKMLINLAESGIPYSMNLITVWRNYFKNSPKTVEAIVRAYIEGVAAIHLQREKALRTLAKYARTNDPKSVEEMYLYATTHLERIPRVEPQAISTILDMMGKKDLPLERFADNSIVDGLVQEGFIEKLYKKPMKETGR